MDDNKAYPIGSVLTAEEWEEWEKFYELTGKDLPDITLDRFTKEGE
jgi:hypothetical protein